MRPIDLHAVIFRFNTVTVGLNLPEWAHKRKFTVTFGADAKVIAFTVLRISNPVLITSWACIFGSVKGKSEK